MGAEELVVGFMVAVVGCIVLLVAVVVLPSSSLSLALTWLAVGDGGKGGLCVGKEGTWVEGSVRLSVSCVMNFSRFSLPARIRRLRRSALASLLLIVANYAQSSETRHTHNC